MQLDIVDVYPSISQTNFYEALEFAKTTTTVTPEEEKKEKF